MPSAQLVTRDLSSTCEPMSAGLQAAARRVLEHALDVALPSMRAQARLARRAVLIGTRTPSVFHTMSPAFAVVECFAALVAAHKGAQAPSALQASQEQLAAFDTYLSAKPKGRSS